MIVAKALAAVRKTPLQDQIGPAKGGWGIVADNLAETDAQSLARNVGALGVPCIAVPASTVVQLPAPQAMTRMDPALFPTVVLMAAAGFTVTSTTTKTVKEGPSAAQKVLSTGILLTTGLPISIGGKDRMVEKTQQQSDRVFYVDLLCKEPLRRFRVDAQRFDYSYLKERKLYQVFGNFKLLVGDFAQAAKGAWRNHGARILLDNKPIQTMGYESLADLERETRWLLTLQARATGPST
jgi:hypothetical protein